jgi:hypothetical protein
LRIQYCVNATNNFPFLSWGKKHLGSEENNGAEWALDENDNAFVDGHLSFHFLSPQLSIFGSKAPANPQESF